MCCTFFAALGGFGPVAGAIRALPRAAARAQSSAEAVVLAIAAILVSRLPFTFYACLQALVALLRRHCRRVFTRVIAPLTASLPKKEHRFLVCYGTLGAEFSQAPRSFLQTRRPIVTLS